MKSLQKMALVVSIILGVLLILGSSQGGDSNGGGSNGGGYDVYTNFYIPKTGQAIVYSQYDDGYYQSGTPRNFQKYDKYVNDAVSGVEWEDSPHVNELMTHDDANEYCLALEWGGFSDWRLPRLYELWTLLEHSRIHPAIEPLFENMPSTEDLPFWTLDSVYTYPAIYTVDFSIGTTEIPDINESSAYTRCIRGYTYERNIDSNKTLHVIYDVDSDLTWQDDNSSFVNHSWEESLQYCENLDFAGHDDWRLPNINELLSMVFIRGDFSFFPSEKTLWSSTTVHLNNSRAFVIVTDEIIYHTFEVNITNKDGSERKLGTDVRCVRGGSLYGDQNRPPEAIDQSVQVEKNKPKDITLKGTDPEHHALTYSMTETPKNGTVTGKLPNITYTPSTAFVGSDSFKFIVNDGELDSKEAIVEITVIESNTRNILKTGQTTSYVNYDDGYYQKGTIRSYTRDDAKQIVTDNTNALIWQDDEEAKTIKKDKAGADQYCSELYLADYDDWRLPTVEELMRVTNKAKVNPAIDDKFSNVASDFYFTATTDKTEENGAADDTYRWLVNFYWGATSTSRMETYTKTFYVRCVRGKEIGQGQFERDNTKGVVKDKSSALIWQDDVNISTRNMTWLDAISYCENLTEATYTDWRLPNFNELFSIWDRSRNAWEPNTSALDSAFEYSSPFGYWSSTSNYEDTDFAWIALYNGSAGVDMPSKTIPAGVRCVHDFQ